VGFSGEVSGAGAVGISGLGTDTGGGEVTLSSGGGGGFISPMEKVVGIG
jgi:hypothetical protein